MRPNSPELEKRVHRAAEAALARQQYVSAIDVLCGMGLLAPVRVDDWRKGQIDFLERVIQGNLHKISSSLAIFRRWAAEKGLKPSETGYVCLASHAGRDRSLAILQERRSEDRCRSRARGRAFDVQTGDAEL